MGQGMAQVSQPRPASRISDIQSLLSQGFKVKAYDVYKPSLEAAVKVGAEPCATPAEAGNVDILGLMVVNALQVEDALFGSGQVAAGMSHSELLTGTRDADRLSSTPECGDSLFLDRTPFFP